MRVALIALFTLLVAPFACGERAQSEAEGWEAFCHVALPENVDPADRSSLVMRAVEQAVSNPDVREVLKALGKVPAEQRPAFIRKRLDATGVGTCPTLDALAP